MNKRKLYKSILENKTRKGVHELAKRLGWDKHPRFRNNNSRRRMKIKARRPLIKAQCLECRQELQKDYEFSGAGMHFEKAYYPFDEYICRECRWHMRGGMH